MPQESPREAPADTGAPLFGHDGAQALGGGLFAIDSGYDSAQFDAIHLLVENGEAIIIDTGTRHSVPRVLAALDELGIATTDVRAVVLTHVHLDHAGGAGALMQELPAARLLVHPRGARHMIDPARLWAGTVSVYGRERAEHLYGELIPVQAHRVRTMADGERIMLGARAIRFIDAPGHALHHHVILDESSGALFTGDSYGIGYRGLIGPQGPMAFPSSTPVQFDPDAMRLTVRRIMALRPSCVLLTHYSRHDAVAYIGEQLLTLIDHYQALGERCRPLSGQARATALTEGMRALLLDAAREHGPDLSEPARLALLDTDARLNADGLASWLDRV
ncbi:MAG: MBL fold metallo-hydrolase [Burkholderiaceae bacterium]